MPLVVNELLSAGDVRIDDLGITVPSGASGFALETFVSHSDIARSDDLFTLADTSGSQVLELVVDGNTLSAAAAEAYLGSANLDGVDLSLLSFDDLNGTLTLAELNAFISNANVDDDGDPRTPTSHGSTHISTGSDPVPIMVGANDGVSDGLDGLVPKPVDGEELFFLRGDGTWVAPAAGTDDSVGVSANDTTPGQLVDKLITSGVAFAEVNDGGDEDYRLDIDSATAGGQGLIELATQGEVDAGTDAVRAVTPATLSASTLLNKIQVTSNDTTPGVLQDKLITATTGVTFVEVNDGGDEDYRLDIDSASESGQGLAEIATQGEVDAGTDTVRYVTPATLAASPFATHIENVRFSRKGNMPTASYLEMSGLRTSDVGHVLPQAGTLVGVHIIMKSAPAGTVTVTVEDAAFATLDSSLSTATATGSSTGLSVALSASEEIRIKLTTTTGNIPAATVTLDIEI